MPQRGPPVLWSAQRADGTRIQRNVRFALLRKRADVTSPFPGRGVGYGQNDPNSFPQDQMYSEGVIFGDARSFDLTSAGLPQSAVVTQAVAKSDEITGKAGGYQNNDHFLVSAVPAALSGQLLPYNPKRIQLTIQNQSTASNLYIQLASAVTFTGALFTGLLLEPGVGYTFDNFCVPSDAVFFAWDPAAGTAIVMEGTRQDNGAGQYINPNAAVYRR